MQRIEATSLQEIGNLPRATKCRPPVSVANPYPLAPISYQRGVSVEKIKKQPTRKCLGCMASFPKTELVRIVRLPDGTVELDLTGKKSGRGAYICKSSACLKKAIKSKRIQNNLEVEISDTLIEALSGEIEN